MHLKARSAAPHHGRIAADLIHLRQGDTPLNQCRRDFGKQRRLYRVQGRKLSTANRSYWHQCGRHPNPVNALIEIQGCDQFANGVRKNKVLKETIYLTTSCSVPHKPGEILGAYFGDDQDCLLARTRRHSVASPAVVNLGSIEITPPCFK